MSRATQILERLTMHRMPTGERERLMAFRVDIEESWRPGDARERRLERRSQMVHVFTCLTTGGWSLLSVGFAGLVVSAGTVALAVAPAPARPDMETGVPTWLGLVLAAAIMSLSVESMRRPRSLQRSTGFFVSVALATGSLGAAMTMQVVLVWDVLLRVALVIGGSGALLAAYGIATARARIARAGWAAIGAAAAGACISDGQWTAIYLADGELLHGTGAALSAAGATFMSIGLSIAKLEINWPAKRET